MLFGLAHLRHLLRPALVLAISTSAVVAVRAQDGANDPTFNPIDDGTYSLGIEAYRRVNAIALQPDGRLILGGDFASYHGVARQRLARVHADGRLDGGFIPATGTQVVRAIALQPDGKVIVGGQGHLVRLEANGALDSGFQAGAPPEAEVHALALQSDGKLIVCGQFTSWAGAVRRHIVRLNTDGSLDPSFSPVGAGSVVRTVALLPDGRAVLGGYFTSYGGVARHRVARIHPDGTLDASFEPGAGFDTAVERVILQPDGRILVAGRFATYQGTTRPRVARLLPNGDLDPSFVHGATVTGAIVALGLQADGRILIGGDFGWNSGGSGLSGYYFDRLNADGTNDVTFPASLLDFPNAPTTSIAVQPDGRIVIGGGFTMFGDVPRYGIVRLEGDGSRDATFNPGRGASDSVNLIVAQQDRRTLIGGSFTEYNGVARPGLARLLPDGALDLGFVPALGAAHPATALAVQPDGRILLGRGLVGTSYAPESAIVRLNSDGSADASFLGGFSPMEEAAVLSIELQPDARIVIGGWFTSYAGTPRANLARLNPDGTLDPSFAAEVSGGSVLASLRQPDGRLWIAGNFLAVNGVPRYRVARLLPDGSLDASFDPGAGLNHSVIAMALQPDGKLLIAGAFGSYDGSVRQRVARVLANGSLDPSFDAGAVLNGSVQALALQPNGAMLVAGAFTPSGLGNTPHIARLAADGTLDTTFDPREGADDAVGVIALQSDGRALLGGAFLEYDGNVRHRIARIRAFDPSSAFCSGDGSATLCPCGNAGATGNGCASSMNPAGASLATSGNASISADTLSLGGSGMPDSSALYFQGTSPVNSGQGTTFGDGLRCAGGAVTRLGQALNAGGASTYPEVGDPLVSVRGGITAPGTFHYQVWYRDVAAFCSPSTFNLTNGLSVTWQP